MLLFRQVAVNVSAETVYTPRRAQLFFLLFFFFSALSLYRVYLSAANHFLQSRGQHTPQRGQPPGGEGGQRPQAPLGSKGRLLSLRASFTHVSLLQAAGACLVKWAATLRTSLSPQLLIAAQRVWHLLGPDRCRFLCVRHSARVVQRQTGVTLPITLLMEVTGCCWLDTDAAQVFILSLLDTVDI